MESTVLDRGMPLCLARDLRLSLLAKQAPD